MPTDPLDQSALLKDMYFPDGTRLVVTRSNRPDAYGYYDTERRVWVHELRHADGRIERFIARTFPGELFEDNP